MESEGTPRIVRNSDRSGRRRGEVRVSENTPAADRSVWRSVDVTTHKLGGGGKSPRRELLQFTISYRMHDYYSGTSAVQYNRCSKAVEINFRGALYRIYLCVCQHKNFLLVETTILTESENCIFSRGVNGRGPLDVRCS